MAYDQSEVPESIRDLLAYMPDEMRQRVLADYEERYAPFLAMLAGWKGAVQAHYAQGQDAAITRLQEQFFPLGAWKFPAQGLAVPLSTPERAAGIALGDAFTDPSDRPWIACGEGWLQPTSLREAAFQMVDRDCVFVVDIEHLGGPAEPILERGQLAFVAAAEAVVAAMASAEWWVLTPGQGYRRASCTRWDGFLAFERELATARMNQRQLDLWLPPFYPYARKMICLRLSRGAEGEQPDFPGFDDIRTGFRFLGIARRPDRRALSALRAQGTGRGSGGALLHLNAVPVVQAAVVDTTSYPTLPRVGQEYALRASGVPDLFAAVAYSNNAAVPASLMRVPSNDPAAREPDVEVRFAQHTAGSAVRTKLYYGSFGQERAGDAPARLERTPLRFHVPFPILGGVSVGGPENREKWARTAWYHSVLRPPLLTEGDLREIIGQRSMGGLADLLRFRYATREILHHPEEGSAHWRTYLWPSVIAREDNFDARYGEIPASNYIPLIQSLRIAFEPGAGAAGIPAFLLADAANYLASVLSQHFVLSSFRIEGRVV